MCLRVVVLLYAFNIWAACTCVHVHTHACNWQAADIVCIGKVLGAGWKMQKTKVLLIGLNSTTLSVSFETFRHFGNQACCVKETLWKSWGLLLSKRLFISCPWTEQNLNSSSLIHSKYQCQSIRVRLHYIKMTSSTFNMSFKPFQDVLIKQCTATKLENISHLA